MVARVCHDPFDYWRGLNNLWRAPFTLVNVEHDMEVSDALVDALLACPHSLCAHAYQMHLPRTYWAHGKPHRDARRLRGEGVEWGVGGDEWADYSAIGLCKMTPEARILGLDEVSWQGLEVVVNCAVRTPWHIHWPAIDHYHR